MIVIIGLDAYLLALGDAPLGTGELRPTPTDVPGTTIGHPHQLGHPTTLAPVALQTRLPHPTRVLPPRLVRKHHHLLALHHGRYLLRSVSPLGERQHAQRPRTPPPLLICQGHFNTIGLDTLPPITGRPYYLVVPPIHPSTTPSNTLSNSSTTANLHLLVDYHPLPTVGTNQHLPSTITKHTNNSPVPHHAVPLVTVSLDHAVNTHPGSLTRYVLASTRLIAADRASTTHPPGSLDRYDVASHRSSLDPRHQTHASLHV
jgi:hypothetical protein